MKKLDNQTLCEIQGGINITASFVASVVRGINSILDLGRSFGSALRRIQFGKMCSL